MINTLMATPKHTVIERTALEFAATFWEAGRSSGMPSKYKNARAFARANFIKFIPQTISILTDMLGRSDVSEHMKKEIHEAIVERINDPRVNLEMGNPLPDIDLKKLLGDKPEPPVIVNTKRIDFHG